MIIGLQIAWVLGGCGRVSPAGAPSTPPAAFQPTLQPTAQATSQPTVANVSDVIIEKGYPVGLTLSSALELRFSSPGAKLYTDALSFEAATQAGLNGFLITVHAPAWLTNCEVFLAEVQLCSLESRAVYLQKVSQDNQSIWLAVPTDHRSALEELDTVSQSVRLQAIELSRNDAL